ncbi:hypothetical protein KEM56_003884 [Ascosphaera pollenicola]|nr:hypothetical protein KEM56_003884 [Ascosphaera pollenicola]
MQSTLVSLFYAFGLLAAVHAALLNCSDDAHGGCHELGFATLPLTGNGEITSTLSGIEVINSTLLDGETSSSAVDSFSKTSTSLELNDHPTPYSGPTSAPLESSAPVKKFSDWVVICDDQPEPATGIVERALNEHNGEDVPKEGVFGDWIVICDDQETAAPTAEGM